MKCFGKLVVVSIVLALACTVNAQMWPLTEGTQEISANGLLEWDGPAGDQKELNLGYGYFLDAGVEVGPRVSYLDNNNTTIFGLDAYTEYHYPVSDVAAPYTGAALGFYNSDDAADSSAATLTLSAGCKVFMVEDLALDVSLNHTMATGDVFAKEDSYENYRTDLRLGLRFFY